MKSGTIPAVLGLAALLWAAQVAVPVPVLAQSGTARTSVKQGDRFVDEDKDGFNDVAPKAGNGQTVGLKHRNRAMRFVDEDGDGISDNAPIFGKGGVSGNKVGSSGQSETRGNVAESENAQKSGWKNGPVRNEGAGIQNALERGRKMGKTEENEEDTIGNNRAQNNNAKNRFGRDYIFNKPKNQGNGNNGSNGGKK